MSGPIIKFEPYPAQAMSEWKGGQHVGTGPTGVRGVHYLSDGNGEYPTGIEACCSAERSQHKNRQIVMQMIEWACASALVPFEGAA
ncbi:peptide chain release factor family protein [Sphingobium cupriresistens]|uniref:peptide chain release factor family protein n=1 Tax=Sphingobium cupriresistens TaxID=1132417 RepID=UPI0011DF3896|nr:peptide chain release factor-like protein [Sphingobium cupriresistens]